MRFLLSLPHLAAFPYFGVCFYFGIIQASFLMTVLLMPIIGGSLLLLVKICDNPDRDNNIIFQSSMAALFVFAFGYAFNTLIVSAFYYLGYLFS